MNKNILVSKADAETIVLNYIFKNTPRTYAKFNPVKLSFSEIVNGTKLSDEDVSEALDKLTEGSSRIEKINVDFEFWLPLDDRGEKLKKELLHKDLAHSSSVALISLLGVLAILYALKYLTDINFITLNVSGYWFAAGAIALYISYQFSKNIANKCSLVGEKIQTVPNYKYYLASSYC